MMINYSIVIPHKNIPDLLQRCLDSIPVREDIQVVVVDDNSDAERVDFEHFPFWEGKNYQVIYTKEGHGAGYARNVGVNNAEGKWVIFADADDYFVDTMSGLLDTHINATEDVLYFKVYQHTFDGKIQEYAEFNKPLLTAQKTGDYSFLRYNMASPWGKMIRSTVLKDNRVWFEEVRYGNDMVFSLRLGCATSNVRVVDDYLYCVVERLGSLTHIKTNKNNLIRLEEACKCYTYSISYNVQQWAEFTVLYYMKRVWIDSILGMVQSIPMLYQTLGGQVLRRLLKRTIYEVYYAYLHKYTKVKHYLDRMCHPTNYPFSAIIMLHRIGKPNPMRLEMNEHLKMDPIELERFIVQAKDNGYQFVSMDELSERITKRHYHRKVIAVTLDDGYRDNFEIGLPLFEKYNVPFCIYVATGLVEKELIYWWNLLEDLILTNDYLSLGNNITYDCTNLQKKEQSFLAVREWILTQPQDNLRVTLSHLFEGYDVNLDKYKDTEALTWEQIKTLSIHPLCTIGCHTHSHKSFSGCSDSEIVEDIHMAESLFEMHIGQKPKHFAFPYGDDCAVNTHHEELLHDLGYVTVATTHESFINVHTDPLRLPRIFIDSKIWKYILSEIKREL